ncbi:MAG: hypothetical protein CM1200mP35_04080 [Chloroflexota bacterium]|nr:MAG: hypothetical protein CM1200mP35_04080 [Chloroflexota bacterium]
MGGCLPGSYRDAAWLFLIHFYLPVGVRCIDSHITAYPFNFRNFVDLDLRLGPGVSVFFGGNAQGKTTILEAMYLLAIARSFRAENERELVNFKAATLGEPALVSGAIEKQEKRFSVYVGYQTQLKSSKFKQIFVDHGYASFRNIIVGKCAKCFGKKKNLE